MATPKLKVYLLGSDYSSSTDNDIQALSKDELYPVVEKNLSALQSHQLVGVTVRDSQLVFPRNVLDEPIMHSIIIGVTANGSTFLSPYIDCQDWRLERNSIKIYVRKTLDGGALGDWGDVSSAYWKYYSHDVKKTYDGEYIETSDSASVAHVFGCKEIQFEIGRLLFEDDTFWTDGNVAGYSYYEPIDSIKIEYTRYHELDGDNADATGYDSSFSILPFGEVYNGNKGGRTGDFVEGNYGYRRSIYPMRQKVATIGGPTVPHDEFLVDYKIDGGKIVCENCDNWILSGDAKPKLFRRFWTKNIVDEVDYTASSSSDSSLESSSSENSSSSTGLTDHYFIYKELRVGVEYTYRFDKIDGTTTVEFQLLPAYYRFDAEFDAALPSELFVRYNEIDDYLGDEFDFNYDYAELGGLDNELGTNTGVVLFRDGYIADGFIYKRKNVLAVQSDYGYDSATDVLLEIFERQDAIGETPAVPAYATITINADDYYFDAKHPLMVYQNGYLIYPSVDSAFEVTVEDNTTTKTIKIAFLDDTKTMSELPKDVMFVYYEKLSVGFGWEVDGGVTSTTENFDAWGYRVVCYEKTRVASQFVSSYPNWVYDHINNSPDIFEGWEEYPGMTTTTVYPHYLDGGYNIYYREGAVTFDTPIEQILTAYDALNFVPAVNTLPADTSAETPALKLYLNPVRANFAYLQGIVNVTGGIMRLYSCQDGRYSYMLLDSEQFPDAVGRRMVLRNDANMPNYFESGGDSYPSLNSANSVDLSIVTSVVLRNNETIKINTKSDRVQSVLFRHVDGVATASIWLNNSFDGITGLVTYPAELGAGDIILSLRMNAGNLEVKELTAPTWTVLEDFDSVVDGGFDDHLGIITSGSHNYEYDNVSWSYTVCVEVLSYRTSAVEFVVYRLEK